MSNLLHPEARTTPKIRAEIKASSLSQAHLAKKHGVTRKTIRKWQSSEHVQDLSHRPHVLNTTLTETQESIVIEIRKTLLLAIDDLLSVTREFINPAASRSGLGRCLNRFGVGNLKKLIAEQHVESESVKLSVKKTFKDYEPGFIHIDSKYLPLCQMKNSIAIYLSPLIVQPAGFFCVSMMIKPRLAVLIFWRL